tara:strand:- start:8520 stop:8819 length:300 start_codon:yes stop_codon:yes gene_type:complete
MSLNPKQLHHSHTYEPSRFSEFTKEEYEKWFDRFPIKIYVDRGSSTRPQAYYFKSLEIAEAFAYALRIKDTRYDLYDLRNEDAFNLSAYQIPHSWWVNH